MGSKLPWILALLFAVALGGSLLVLVQANAARQEAEKAQVQALQAKKEGEEAVVKALAAREQAETAKAQLETSKKQTEEALVATKTELSVAKGTATEQTNQAPKLEAELAAARKALADIQRLNPNVVVPKPETAKVATAPTPRHAENGWSVPEMLPPDTLGLITIRDVPTTITKAKETGIYKILASPDVERVFRKQMGQARGAIFAGEVMLGEKLSDLLSFVSQGEITFAVLGVDKRLPNGMPMAEMMLSIQLRDKAPAFVAEFNKRLDQLKAATGGTLQFSQAPLGNTTVTRLKYADFPAEISCGLCDGTFLICIGEGRLEKLMAMHEKMKAAPKVDGAAPEVLAQVPAFKKALEKSGPDADLIAYVNIEAVTANPIINDPAREMNATQRHELEMSGLKEVKAASYSFGVKDTGVRETIFLDVPAANRKGALGLIDGESADLNAFYAAPRNSVLAWTFKVNPEQLLEKGIALAEIENAQARENAAAVLLIIGQQLNIDPKKDILGSLTGQGVFSLSVPHKNEKLPLAFPQPILTLRIKDQEGFKRMAGALVTAGQEKFEFKELVDSGKTIVVARARDAAPDQLQGFCYVIDGDDALFSIYPLALREEIKRRASKGGRLDDDPDFNLARAAMTGQPQAMLYLDTAALGVAAYDSLIPIAQMQVRDPQIDLNALPTADLLSRNLGGALMDLHLAADGILIEGYSPSGVLALLVPAAAGANAARARNMAMVNDLGGATPVTPAPAPAATRAFRGPQGRGDAKKIESLQKLARDLKEYAVEHGGDFPKTLDDMRPKYLQDLGKDIEQIVFLGKQAAENRIVAHSSDKLAGNIAILLQNLSVQTVLRQDLPRVQRDGFTEPGKSVKPPKPPEF